MYSVNELKSRGMSLVETGRDGSFSWWTYRCPTVQAVSRVMREVNVEDRFVTGGYVEATSHETDHTLVCVSSQG